jgi:DNA-binding response OmpR family regulator
MLPVWVDRDNFDKVIMNLLSNAFKFTPTGGDVTISLTHTDAEAIITVRDTGCGIPKDKLETIFQRFYQSPTRMGERNTGTGIGLDLTRSLVELHYGTITARNNSEGPGSSFVVTLPLGNKHLKPEEMVADDGSMNAPKHDDSEADKQLAQELNDMETDPLVHPVASRDDNSKPTIAIVEDDDEIASYLQTELSNEYNVRYYPNGKVALAEILKDMPNLVISDVMMPEMDGITLCTKLKSNINTNHLPVILLTAKSRDEDRMEGLETGADAYVVKPFNMDILRRTIANLLAVRRTLKNKFTGQEDQADKVNKVDVQTPDDKFLQRVMDVINDNLSNSDLGVDDIADRVGISRVHLYRKMKELTNQTPHNFIKNLRLKQAARLLENPKQSITEVMYACGFSNSASFSTMFKNMFGMSPRDYQRSKM